MKILVVEDDQLIRQMLTLLLEEQPYTVEVASDGSAAWDLLQAYSYDLVILDLTLPKVDGLTLCRQIRHRGSQTPILMLTGRENHHDRALGLDAGADDYVTKPFDAEELLARVRALLRRSGPKQTHLSWGALDLDPRSCQVTYGGQTIALTPKEYALMELFLRHPQQVFSCGAILDHLWHAEEAPGEEAIRTHIKGLRQKLKTAQVTPDPIETVYGLGYRLKAPTATMTKPPTVNNPSKRILIVDNEPHIREVTQLALEVVAGWQVITAESGQEAIEQACRHAPDAILMDVMMPEMDGFTTSQKLQENPLTQPIPILLFTAQTQPFDPLQYLTLGIRHTIAKPFDPILLAQEIATTLGWPTP